MKKLFLRTILFGIIMVFRAMGALAGSWSIDFVALGANYGDNTDVTISSTFATIDGTTMGTCTVAGESLGSRFVLQTGTNWTIRKAYGLRKVDPGRQAMGLLGCTKGQTITIVGTGDPNPSTNATLKSHVDNTYTYVVNEDGDVKFTPVDRLCFTSVAVEDPSSSELIDAATLIHGDEMSMYYGFYALRDAYNHSVSGDVITLSEGTFASVNINKSVTIRGVGISDNKWTYIENPFTIDIPSNDPNSFSMEGVTCGYVTLLGTFSNPFFNKCSIRKINSEGTVNNESFVNCYITSGCFFSSNSSAQFINCYISMYDYNNKSEGKTNVLFINCILELFAANFDSIDSNYFLNSIFYSILGTSTVKLKSTNLAEYCVAVNCPNLFDNIQNGNHNSVTTTWELFVNTNTFDLTDEAKLKYLGVDGTEVGLYGGIMPFLSETPSYPIITKKNIAKRTTNDGKLSVDIEVRAVE